MRTVKTTAPTMAHSSLRLAERESGGRSGLRRSCGRFAILRGLLLGLALRSAADEQRACQGSAQGVNGSLLVSEGDHAIQGAYLLYGERPPGHQPALSQVCKHRGALVVYAGDEDALAYRRRRERERPV